MILYRAINSIITASCKLENSLVRQRIFLKLRKNVLVCRFESSTGQEAISVLKKEKIDLSKYPPENIRNFSIIAHIDHGKSTLADRILEITGTINPSEENAQVLDKLPVERERGITVKAQTASIFYEYKSQSYLLNLIDTPGHVDFTYEVSRSLAACQGVVLLVDANQGIQAQTIANFYLAFGADLIIIPVLNKIDLKNAKPEEVAIQMKNTFEIEEKDIIKVSAKLGTGVDKLLYDIIEKIPPPRGNPSGPLRALLFDMWYDKYRGVIALIAVVDGKIKVGDTIESFHTGKTYEVKDVGILHPEELSSHHLLTGQVGFIVPNVRSAKELHIGDTFFHAGQKIDALSGFKPAKPMVFAGVYPMDQSQNVELRNAVEKLTLNDASVTVAIDSSPALGQGWRLGFLGLLHMDVFNQRLEQEYGAEVIFTTPSVPYKAKPHGEKNIKRYGSEEITITNPLHFPDSSTVSEYLEPFVIGTIITPDTYMGKVISLCLEKRGTQKDSVNIDNSTVMMTFKLPLNEIIVDFFDELKRFSSGFASFDYEECGYEPSDLTKLTILLNGKLVEELTCIVHVSKARTLGKRLCEKLKDSIPQQMFEIAVQATIGNKIIARETIKALRKNVLAKCYGGDISRKMKLLKRQAEGKKRMRMIGNVEVPRDIFIKVLQK